MEKIRNLTPLQIFNKTKKRNNLKVLSETKKVVKARDHLSKEEIKEYSILYIMLNFPKIILPRSAIFNDLSFSSKSLNDLKTELIKLIVEDKFNDKNIEIMKVKYPRLIQDINQNSFIKSIFLKKDEGQQIDLLNEILKELNEIKFSKRIDELENKLMKDFDEKSYSDLMELKSQRNKE